MNYQELVSLSIAYADRYDLEVSQNIDNFILMVESRINRLLKTREQTSRSYTATKDDAEYYSLPPDWAGMRDIQYNSGLPTANHKSVPMNMLNPEQMNIQRNSADADPCYVYYTVIANQIQIWPTQSAGGSIEMVYFQKLPNLNAAPESQTNWLSDSNPDIYMAGMTAEIELFAKNYEASQVWFQRLKGSVDELDNIDWVERWSGSNLTTKVG